MKKTAAHLLSALFTLSLFVVPMLVGAQDAPGGGYKLVVDCAHGDGGCTWQDAVAQINKIINFLLWVAMILAVFSFIYAGFKLLLSGGNEDAVKHAKHIFKNVVIGLALAYAAWIIVNFITTTLGVKPGYDLL